MKNKIDIDTNYRPVNEKEKTNTDVGKCPYCGSYNVQEDSDYNFYRDIEFFVWQWCTSCKNEYYRVYEEKAPIVRK